MESPGFTPVQFGDAGWRAVIARDFTFANLRLATQAVAQYLKTQLADPNSPLHRPPPNHNLNLTLNLNLNPNLNPNHPNSPLRRLPPTLIIAHDCRFLGPQFALAVAEVLTAAGLRPLLCNRATPAPALALAIRKRRAIGGINLTAGPLPPEYSGFQFSLGNGAAATPEVSLLLEAAIRRLQQENWTFPAVVTGTFQTKTFDPQPDYFNQMQKLVDFAAIKKARLHIALDLMYGCGRGYLDTLLLKAGAKLTVFHNESDAFFGGHPPEPSAPLLSEVRQAIRRGQAQLGLATDGDAGRCGVVDNDGAWLTPGQILALALYHLKKNRGWTGSVVRTVRTSRQVDAVARLFGVPVRETPPGFHHIGALMETGPVIVGGDESGGLTVQCHVPEKDGILACLLMAELVAAERKPLRQILKALARQTTHWGHI
ncbi:MAG: phosphoglucomutase/phosphomannomutase family protein [Verrucomicrobiota bacterium]|jgi:phosphomannomutase